MKVRVRYVGSNEAALLSTSPDQPTIQFSRYGQLVEMDEQLFYDISAGLLGARLPLLLDDEFQQIGHTSEELIKFANPARHEFATPEFAEKVKKVNKRLLEIHSAASDKPQEVNDHANQ